MPKHVKPTPEELQARIDESLKELDAPEPTPDPEPELVPEPTPEPELEPVPIIPEPEPAPEPTLEPKDGNGGKLPSIEKRYKESSNEARILFAKNKALNEAILAGRDLKEPTDEEMQVRDGDWDMKSDAEKKIAKGLVLSDKRWELIDKSAEPLDIEKWSVEVQDFIDDPVKMKAHPELAGKEEQFMEYATTVVKSSVPFELVVSGFLHDHGLKKVPNKGQMFPTGSGGPNEILKPKSDVLTVSEGMALMRTNMEQYRELAKAGKISTDPDYIR